MRTDARQRRFLVTLTGLAALCLLAQGLTGVPELTLYLTPLFLIATLLLSGHYVAEDAIVRGWRGVRRVARRMLVRRVAVPETRFLSSLLERSPLRRRGPPGEPVAHQLTCVDDEHDAPGGARPMRRILPAVGAGALLLGGAAGAPAQQTAPPPCNGVAQIEDPVADSHHPNVDVTRAWFHRADDGRVTVNIQVANLVPAIDHAEHDRVLWRAMYTAGGERRYVQATFRRGETDATYEHGRADGLKTTKLADTTGALFKGRSGVVQIALPDAPDGAVLGSPVVAGAEANAVETTWFERAPGGDDPADPNETSTGSDFRVAVCTGSSAPSGTGQTPSSGAPAAGGGAAGVSGVSLDRRAAPRALRADGRGRRDGLAGPLGRTGRGARRRRQNARRAHHGRAGPLRLPRPSAARREPARPRAGALQRAGAGRAWCPSSQLAMPERGAAPLRHPVPAAHRLRADRAPRPGARGARSRSLRVAGGRFAATCAPDRAATARSSTPTSST